MSLLHHVPVWCSTKEIWNSKDLCGLKLLNENVLRETHSIPKLVDDRYHHTAHRSSSLQQAGHQQWVLADPSVRRIKATYHLSHPSKGRLLTTSDLRRFISMVNQLGELSTHITNLTQPLRELLSTKQARVWDVQQETAFDRIKSRPYTSRCQ